MQVMSDFDYTMSAHKDGDGELCWTTHRVMEAEAAIVSPELGREVGFSSPPPTDATATTAFQLDALKEKYMAIEFDPGLSKEEKTPHMVTWWETAHGKIASAGFKRSHLVDGVRRSRIVLRSGLLREDRGPGGWRQGVQGGVRRVGAGAGGGGGAAGGVLGRDRGRHRPHHGAGLQPRPRLPPRGQPHDLRHRCPFSHFDRTGRGGGKMGCRVW